MDARWLLEVDVVSGLFQDLGDNIEKSSKQLSMGIARCYPVKNRSVDIMPCTPKRIQAKNFLPIWLPVVFRKEMHHSVIRVFTVADDYNRVVISGKDDYINASHIGDLMPSCPKVITTQCPIPATMTDYWQMVYEQGTEVIVMLAHENETGKVSDSPPFQHILAFRLTTCFWIETPTCNALTFSERECFCSFSKRFTRIGRLRKASS